MKNSTRLLGYKLAIVLLTFFVAGSSFSQNKMTPKEDGEGRSVAALSKNPFYKFIGEWTLKDDSWTQNWGNGTEQVKIPHHHTTCQPLNTDNSLLAVIDGTPPYGHIFWSYNPVKKEVDHLSSFGTNRAGVGKGSVNENGDVSLKISFADEAEGTYRLYTYTWISNNEYELKSVQYDSRNQPTGLMYGGTFVRILQKK